MRISKLIVGMLMFIPSITAIHAAEPDNYLVVPYVVNPVTNGKTWREIARDCMKDKLCGGVVDAAGSYVGIPPGTIKKTMDVADAIGLGVEQRVNGEIYRYNIDAPPGYFLCRAHLKMISVAPDN